MRYVEHGRFRQQVRFLQCQFLQHSEMPFANVLSAETVSQALEAVGCCVLDRIYTPMVTLWVFLTQVLSADHSCRAAIARLIAHRISQGNRPCSPESGAYCQARKRLPEQFFSNVARKAGQTLDAQANPRWLWKQRRVYAFDGATVSMPDTPNNQEAYPQLYNQRPGLGFPLARIAAIFSLSCGAVVDLGICRYAGKGQGELSLLRALWGFFRAGDVLLTDRLMCSWTEIYLLKQRGIDSVTRLSKRRADFRRGKRLSHGDHIVQWRKPGMPRGMAWSDYKSMPAFLTMRETLINVEQPGFRSQRIIVATTLLDDQAVSKADLAQLYRARWNAELDLRSLKQTMQMEVLRCKTPSLVRKEIWTHILAYNLIRTIMAQAAARYGIEPRSISFKGAIQTLEAFQPAIALKGPHSSVLLIQLFAQLLRAVARHRVANRPDRVEPRLKKRRPNHYHVLCRPRAEAKERMMKGLAPN